LKLKTSAILIAGALFGAATLPAQANNDAMMDLLQVLRDKGTISNDDYKLLTNAAAADKEMAEADADFWVGHTSHDYGVVKKITINLEDDVFNTNLDEQRRIKEYIKENPNRENSKERLKEWEWYNENI